MDDGIERKEPFVVLATLRLERGDTQGALSWLDRALAADPSDGWTWYLRAQAFVMRESQPEAIQAFRRATELLPDLLRMRATLPRLQLASAETLLRLAAVDEARGDLELAESWLDAALDLAPESGPVHLARGRLLRHRGRTDEALAELLTASDLEPRSFLVRSELGLLQADLGQVDDSIETLRSALALPPPEGWTREDHEAARKRVAERIEELEERGELQGPALPPRD